MAIKKQFMSVAAASMLAASFTMTGCGSSSSSNNNPSSSSVSSSASSASSVSSSSSSVSSSSSSVSSSASSETNSSSSSSSSVAPGAMSVRVSDAYVVSATVTAGSTEATIEVGNGVYEWNSTVAGTFEATGGVNDLNRDGNATNGEPFAPSMKAPAGYTNINPFTTKLVDGEADMNTTYPFASAVEGTDGLMYNYDVVAAGAANIEVAKETAKAALSISGYPGDGNATSSASSVSSVSSSAASSSSANGVFPAAERSPFPDKPSSSSEASSSSEVASSSSSEAAGGTAYAEIDNCLDTLCIDATVKKYMGELNGVYGDTSSSSESNSSSSEAASSEASSSSANGVFPAAAL